MADIELVIKISEEEYEMVLLKMNTSVIAGSCSAAEKMIANGTPLDNIKAKIEEDLANVENEGKQTQDDVDCGIAIGLKMAIDAIDKHTRKDGKNEVSD